MKKNLTKEKQITNVRCLKKQKTELSPQLRKYCGMCQYSSVSNSRVVYYIF